LKIQLPLVEKEGAHFRVFFVTNVILFHKSPSISEGSVKAPAAKFDTGFQRRGIMCKYSADGVRRFALSAKKRSVGACPSLMAD
jgi:hypothetical protein